MLDDATRKARYLAQTGSTELTARQSRRANHKANRALADDEKSTKREKPATP